MNAHANETQPRHQVTAPPAPTPVPVAPTPAGTVAEAFGMSGAQLAGSALLGILIGLGIGWLLRKLYRYLFDVNCWTETCTLIEDTSGGSEVVEGPDGTPVVVQPSCDYICDTPFGIITNFLAEHIPGRPCPKRIVARKCRYRGMVLTIWVEVDGVRRGLKKP